MVVVEGNSKYYARVKVLQTVVDAMDFWKKQPNSRVLTQVDVRGFWRLFLSGILKGLNGRPAPDLPEEGKAVGKEEPAYEW